MIRNPMPRKGTKVRKRLPPLRLDLPLDQAAPVIAAAVQAAKPSLDRGTDRSVVLNMAVAAVLRHLGFEASTVPAHAMRFTSDEFRSLYEKGSGTYEAGYGRGYETSSTLPDGSWNGHLVCVADGMIIDAATSRLLPSATGDAPPLAFRPSALEQPDPNHPFPFLAPKPQDAQHGIGYIVTPENRYYLGLAEASDHALHERVAGAALAQLVRQGLAIEVGAVAATPRGARRAARLQLACPLAVAAPEIVASMAEVCSEEWGSELRMCVPASLALATALRKLGIAAHTRPMEILTHASSDDAAADFAAMQRGDSPVRWRDHFGMTLPSGAPAPPPPPNAWKGHMVVIADGLLLDPTARQFAERDAEACHSIVLEVPPSFGTSASDEYIAAPVDDPERFGIGSIAYRPEPSNAGYTDGTNWFSADLHERLACQLLDALQRKGIVALVTPSMPSHAPHKARRTRAVRPAPAADQTTATNEPRVDTNSRAAEATPSARRTNKPTSREPGSGLGRPFSGSSR